MADLDGENPMSRRASHETVGVIAATILVGSAAILVMGLQPILLGGLAERGVLSQSGLGYAATLELFGFAIGASVGPFVMNGRLRLKASVVSLVLAAVNLSIYAASTSILVLFERSLAGILEGVLMGAVSLIITHTSRPERLNGLMVGLGTIPQVAMAYLVPALIVPRFGIASGFVVLAAFAGLAAAFSLGLPDRVKAHHEHSEAKVRWTLPLAGVVAVVFLENAGASASWNYVERLGHQAQVSPALVGVALSVSLAVQVTGALLGAWLSWRLSSRLVLIISNLAEGLIVGGLALTVGAGSFLTLTLLFGIFWTSQTVFQVNQLIRLDPTRRIALLLPPITMLGLAVGPMLSALVVSDSDVRPGYWVASAALLAAGAILMLPRRGYERAALDPAVKLGPMSPEGPVTGV